MDVSIEEMRSKPVRIWTTLMSYYNECTFLKSTVYVSYIVPSTELRFFSREGGRGSLAKFQALRSGANSKRSAYLKLGAKNPDPLRPGVLPYNREGDARRTTRIKPLNEINLGMAQDFFDKGDYISSNTVWQCLFLYQGISLRTEDEIGWNHPRLP